MNKLEQTLAQVRSEVGGDFIATDVVGMDGLSIAANSANPNFDGAAASARFAMVSKLGQKVTGRLNVGDMADLLVVTDGIYLLVRLLGDGSYYWGLSVTKDATLGMVRMVMNEYADPLWKAIPR